LEKHLEDRSWTNSRLAKHGIDAAQRILEEYAWRERPLNDRDADALSIESLINTITAECRSKVGFSIFGWIDDLNEEARMCFYTILLEIVENIPSRKPRLHT
jgi:hypothetical protein